MSKTTAPLLSFSGSGQLAKTMVYSSWKGVPYVRRYVVPANPQSTGQTETRTIFRFLSQLWSMLPTIAREPWDAYAKGKPLTARNGLIGKNTAFLRKPSTATDLERFSASAGALGGPPPVSITPTPGDNNISYAVVAPTAPLGWVLIGAQGLILLDQDPTDEFAGYAAALEDETDPYVLNFTGLTEETDYCASIWLKWSKPGGQTAYSIAVTDLSSTT
jgi:hypothetical protein